MTIVQECKNCGKRSKVKPAHLGRSVKCPKCGNVQVAMPRVPPNAQFSSAKPVAAVEEEAVSDGLSEFLDCLEAAEAEPAVPKVSGRQKGRIQTKPEAKAPPVWIKPSEIEPVMEEVTPEEAPTKKPEKGEPAESIKTPNAQSSKKPPYIWGIVAGAVVVLLSLLLFVSLYVDSDEEVQLRVRTEIKKGNDFRDRGDDDKAIASFTEAIRLDPNLVVPYHNRGRAYLDNDKYDKAIEDFTEVIRLNPDNDDVVTRETDTEAYFDRGVSYLKKGESNKAIDDLTEVIRLNPDDAKAYMSRGLAYNVKGEYDKAIKDCTEAIRLDPNLAKAYNNRGNAYSAKGKDDKAIKDFSQVIRLDPNNADAYFNRSSEYSRKGDRRRAKADYDKAKSLGWDP